MFGPKGPFCQSCGVPLNKDKTGGGTEKDGSKSKLYCGNCYLNGAFTQPNITFLEMQKLVDDRMKDMHLPGFMRHHFMKDMPKLQRWQSK